MVSWDSPLGLVIRKNKIAFRITERPRDDVIYTDIASVGSVLAGVVNNNLNPRLTAEGVLLRVMASSVYPRAATSDNS